MRFKISGVDKETGAPIELLVEESDVASAVAFADRKGIHTTAVTPLESSIEARQPPPIPLAESAARSGHAAPSKPQRRIWFGLYLLVSAVVTPAFPGYGLTIGVLLAGLVVAYLFIEPMQGRLETFLRVSTKNPGVRVIKLIVLSATALVLIALSFSGFSIKRDVAEAAARVEEAEARVDALILEARTEWKSGNETIVEQKLEEASKIIRNSSASAAIRRKAVAVTRLLTEMADAKIGKLVEESKAALMANDIELANGKLQAALEMPYSSNLADAKELAQQIKSATDLVRIRDALMNLADEEFQRLKGGGKLPEQMLSGFEVLDRRRAELVKAEVKQVAEAREELQVAKAEAERQRLKIAKEKAAEKLKAEKEAARKAEEELDVGGLVIMRKTLKGSTTGVTGIVINRRQRKLSYAQITFNLYDDSGAQVGSALANINGLEPGGQWKFSASSFGTEYTTYKFSELTGF